MQRTYVKDLKNKIGEQVSIKGFVHAIRDQGGIKFLIIRDVTGLIQAVVLKSEKAVFDFVKELTLESVIEIEGLVKDQKNAPNGFEILALTINLLSKSEAQLPIPVVTEKSGEETDQTIRFDYRWIDLRKPEKLAIFKAWTEFEKGIRKYFDNNNYLQIYTPSFMSTSSESGAEVFEVKYFDRKAYLAQSPQFYKQMAMAAGFEKIFVWGPVYRAEPSYTTRHVTEFTGLDFEISYIESHHDIMSEMERMLIAGFTQLKASGIAVEIPFTPFPQMTLKEVKEKIKHLGIKNEKDYDINAEEERELGRIVKEETGHDFVFVIDWPIQARPFYHMRHGKNMELTKSFDLVYKGLEIVTGAQREHRSEILEKQAVDKGMDLEAVKEYISFFKYGCPPHGGVGIGPARIIMKMLDLPSIKEAIFLPRDVKRLTP